MWKQPDQYWFDRAEVTLRDIKQALAANGLGVYEIKVVDKLKQDLKKCKELANDACGSPGYRASEACEEIAELLEK